MASVFTPMPLRRVRDGARRPALAVRSEARRFPRCRARLLSRKGHPFRAFDGIRTELIHIVGTQSAVLDGEIVWVAADGRSLFDSLFYRRAEAYFLRL
jgi:ATP-dependent DNA ligase